MKIGLESFCARDFTSLKSLKNLSQNTPRGVSFYLVKNTRCIDLSFSIVTIKQKMFPHFFIKKPGKIDKTGQDPNFCRAFLRIAQKQVYQMPHILCNLWIVKSVFICYNSVVPSERQKTGGGPGGTLKTEYRAKAWKSPLKCGT